jgi:hypothetical protein
MYTEFQSEKTKENNFNLSEKINCNGIKGVVFRYTNRIRDVEVRVEWPNFCPQ